MSDINTSKVPGKNIANRIAATLNRPPRPRPEVFLTISNLSRDTILASRVLVADQAATRRKGLLGRNALPPDEGLWIVPCEAIHTVGMNFAIDLVYLDRKNIVKKVRSNVKPWRMSACLSAHSTIELAAGTVQRTQTRRGDRLAFSAALPTSGNESR